MSDWISAVDACEALGIRAQSLYAYTSRGRLQAKPDPAEPASGSQPELRTLEQQNDAQAARIASVENPS